MTFSFRHLGTLCSRCSRQTLMGLLLLQGVIFLLPLLITPPGEPRIWLMVLSLSGLVTLLLLTLLLKFTINRPQQLLEEIINAVASGDLEQRIPIKQMGLLDRGAITINRLLEYNSNHTYNMDGEIRRQSDKFAQKTRSLQTLYDVTLILNSSRDLDDMLNRFLEAMEDFINARAGIIRLVQQGGLSDEMELIASRGISAKVIEREKQVPLNRCLCGNAFTSGKVLFQRDLTPCSSFTQTPLFVDEAIEMVAIPLQYHQRLLGIYTLFIDRSHINPGSDVNALYSSLGQHLGMAIERARMDESTRRHTILKERNTLAHELHDSLAQTLASLRFQVSMLDDALSEQTITETREEISQIKGGLDEAYMELRELLAHFRAPSGVKGLLPALEDLISNFRNQTGMRVLLQKEWEASRLPANLELQIIRIIQEALTNIRKHSQANTVRVLMRCDPEQNFNILIEDDGIGMERPAFSGHPGEHLGLSIMKERAQYLDGDLRIESEPGEGTRVQLSFTQPSNKKAPSDQHFALI
ncbi:MAG: GAF domain-containing protein [Gammaproteobacteria bacterium]|nr:GAF domain-containing protein [Gammaproteobacteria bacterium]